MLILASASPRRRELLTQAGFTFDVHPAHIPEDPLPDEDPIAYVTRLARQKAEAVFHELNAHANPERALKGHDFSRAENAAQEVGTLAPGASNSGSTPSTPASLPPGAPGPSHLGTGETTAPPLIVLGSDTTVTLDNQILGKPSDASDAARMLRLLSGRTHRVITGVALVTAARTEVAAEVTAVTFLTLSDDEIAAYIATGEPMDKAGAYAIQGRAARWIPRIVGDYFNVVGLPLALVATMLESR